MAAQYYGSVGKIAKGQMGMYWGYASQKGYSLIEGQLFMSDQWFACASTTGTGEEERVVQRQACAVPQDLVFKTKPEIGLALL